jgi:hypothetical protein
LPEELRLIGHFPTAASGNKVVDGVFLTCRLLMSLRSISAGNLTIPNKRNDHLGLPVLVLFLSDFDDPTLLTEEFRSISGTGDTIELCL